jgi:hypothetical protein
MSCWVKTRFGLAALRRDFTSKDSRKPDWFSSWILNFSLTYSLRCFCLIASSIWVCNFLFFRYLIIRCFLCAEIKSQVFMAFWFLVGITLAC